jgi:hypothetical protein
VKCSKNCEPKQVLQPKSNVCLIQEKVFEIAKSTEIDKIKCGKDKQANGNIRTCVLTYVADVPMSCARAANIASSRVALMRFDLMSSNIVSRGVDTTHL